MVHCRVILVVAMISVKFLTSLIHAIFDCGDASGSYMETEVFGTKPGMFRIRCLSLLVEVWLTVRGCAIPTMCPLEGKRSVVHVEDFDSFVLSIYQANYGL